MEETLILKFHGFKTNSIPLTYMKCTSFSQISLESSFKKPENNFRYSSIYNSFGSMTLFNPFKVHTYEES